MKPYGLNLAAAPTGDCWDRVQLSPHPTGANILCPGGDRFYGAAGLILLRPHKLTAHHTPKTNENFPFTLTKASFSTYRGEPLILLTGSPLWLQISRFEEVYFSL